VLKDHAACIIRIAMIKHYRSQDRQWQVSVGLPHSCAEQMAMYT
jgi:hypothetical protein